MTGRQFTDLVEGSQAALRRFLVALCCGDTALADDIAQDAYLKAYIACDRLNDPDKFKVWIFSIAYNTFISNRRAVKQFADYDETRNLAAVETSDSAFRYQALYAALNRLPDKERTSVLLYYMEGYSIKEIAEIEETSQDAVKQHLSRGRNHLRGLLSND